ncbi:hypothetical protein [Marinimicrobium sp. C2-29]|uniref:hypothetical protein n=1 Tax=Marinimicrobium sp. C2-29 TaxID=3139825 RepID=UPI00313901A6
MQQVNLYLPEFHPRREPLSARHMGAAVLAALIIMVLWSLWSASRTGQLESQLETERAELQTVQAQVQELTARLPARRGDSVEEQVARLRDEVRRREQILRLITRQNLGNAEGFSRQLQTLARQSMEDLALERISLLSGGNYAELSGRVRQPELVPVYLQRLRSEQSFARVGFGVLNVAREPDDRGPGLTFSVQRADRESSGQRSGDSP